MSAGAMPTSSWVSRSAVCLQRLVGRLDAPAGERYLALVVLDLLRAHRVDDAEVRARAVQRNQHRGAGTLALGATPPLAAAQPLAEPREVDRILHRPISTIAGIIA